MREREKERLTVTNPLYPCNSVLSRRNRMGGVGKKEEGKKIYLREKEMRMRGKEKERERD